MKAAGNRRDSRHIDISLSADIAEKEKAHETPEPDLMGLIMQPLGESNPSLQNENLSS